MSDGSVFLKLLEESRISDAVQFVSSLKANRQIFLAALGDHFMQSGDLRSARRFYSESISVSPNPAAEFGIGNVLLSEGALKECLPFFFRSAAADTHRIASLLKIGMAERLLGNIKASLRAYLAAKNGGYDKYVLDVNLATLLSDMGEFSLAGEYYEKAMTKAPDNDKVRFNYSLHLLSMGELSKGMAYYESRPWCYKGFGKEWMGEKGKSVLVLSEQGYGDLIQFSRFLYDLSGISDSVALSCDKNMSGLVRSLGIVNETIDMNEDSLRAASERYPHYCRIMSVPFRMGLDIKARPPSGFVPDEGRISFWESRLAGDDGLKVGLCWQGGKRKHSEMMFNDRKRSVDLSLFRDVLDVEGVHFYSLQKDWKEPHPKIKDYMGECGDFLDTGTFIKNMDLVISVDTAIAHLSASLGKPVWMLSRLGGCWRWGNHGSDTFWYPTMRILRQSSIDDWSSVMKEVKESLAKIVGER